MHDDDEPALQRLRARIGAIHDVIMHALRMRDYSTADRALEQQRALMEEYRLMFPGDDPQRLRP
jgi:hypothetical protein